MRKLFLTFLFCLIAYSAQAQFACDVFTDTATTALTAHSSVNGGLCAITGSTWTQSAGTGLTINISNQVENSGTVQLGDQFAAISPTPPTADYSVQMKCQGSNATGATSNRCGVYCRKQSGADTFYAFYQFSTTAGSRGFRFAEFTAGAEGAPVTYLNDWVANTEYTLKIECVGSAIKGYVDGTERVSTTDASITAAGVAGIYLRNTAGNLSRGDDFIATDLTPAGRRRMSFMGD